MHGAGTNFGIISYIYYHPFSHCYGSKCCLINQEMLLLGARSCSMNNNKDSGQFESINFPYLETLWTVDIKEGHLTNISRSCCWFLWFGNSCFKCPEWLQNSSEEKLITHTHPAMMAVPKEDESHGPMAGEITWRPLHDGCMHWGQMNCCSTTLAFVECSCIINS